MGRKRKWILAPSLGKVAYWQPQYSAKKDTKTCILKNATEEKANKCAFLLHRRRGQKGSLTWLLSSCRFVGSLASLPLPDSSSARQHLLLFISALIPKALASLLTSFTLALANDRQARLRALDEPCYLDGVLLEVQRLWPPFIGGRRIANQVCLN